MLSRVAVVGGSARRAVGSGSGCLAHWSLGKCVVGTRNIPLVGIVGDAGEIGSFRFSTDTSRGSVEETEVDFCVIGGGSGGFAAAARASDLGQHVAIVEAHRLGGAGVWNGALTSKTLWQLSRDYRARRKVFQKYKIDPSLEELGELGDATRVAHQIAERREQFMERQVEYLGGGRSRERFLHSTEGGPDILGPVEIHRGWGKFEDPHTVAVLDNEGNVTSRIKAEKFVISTGSRPRKPTLCDVDSNIVLTSDDIGSLTHFPKSFAVIGAGVIGCEFATIMANFGVKTHLINERRERLLPSEDPDLSDWVTNNLRRIGVSVYNNVQVEKIDVGSGEAKITMNDLKTGEQSSITSPQLLYAIGRVPIVHGMGLEEIGVELSKTGGISVDKNGVTTTHPHIAAAGDVTADTGLVNVAEMEARHVVEVLLGYRSPDKVLSYQNISSIMFLRPEVACVGMNEQEAIRQSIPHRTAVVGLDTVSRSMMTRYDLARRDINPGYVKLVVKDSPDMKLLGMRAVGSEASSIIEAAALVIDHGRSALDLGNTLHPHPAITEAVQEAVRMLTGSSLLKPQVFKSCRVTTWCPVSGFKHIVEPSHSLLVPSYLN